MSNISKFTEANVPGVGRVNVLNVTGLVSLFLGLTVLAFAWTYAQRTAIKAQGWFTGMANRARSDSAPAQDSGPAGKMMLSA